MINLRPNGNGIFWLKEHAEEMLLLRALVISRRWDKRVQQMRSWTKKNHLADWKWTPCPMSSKVEPQAEIAKTAARSLN